MASLCFLVNVCFSLAIHSIVFDQVDIVLVPSLVGAAIPKSSHVARTHWSFQIYTVQANTRRVCVMPTSVFSFELSIALRNTSEDWALSKSSVFIADCIKPKLNRFDNSLKDKIRSVLERREQADRMDRDRERSRRFVRLPSCVMQPIKYTDARH